MSNFIANLAVNLLVKEFLKSVNIWRSYKQNGLLRHMPTHLALLSLKCRTRQISKIPIKDDIVPEN